jgi:hypothetical protein
MLGFAVSAAQADTVLAQYFASRDNFNANYHFGQADSECTWNAGATGNWRFSKVQQEGTYYCDWSADDKAALAEAIANWTPSAPGNTLEVMFAISGTSGASAIKDAHVQTLDSYTDWVEGANDRATPTPGQTGACDAYAVYDGTNPGSSTQWQTAVQGNARQPVDQFWDLPSQYTNTQDIMGWKNGPSDDDLNTVVLDSDLVSWLLGGSPYCRGLRFWQDGYDGTENAGCAAIGQWGGLGSSGGRLMLVEVPEPASMALLVIGGVGVLLRKKR